MAGLRRIKFDAEGERALEVAYARRTIEFIRALTPLTISIDVAFLAWDWTLDPSKVPETLELRVLIAGILGGLYLSTYSRSFLRFHQYYITTMLVLVGGGIVVILDVLPRGFELGIAGVNLVMMAAIAAYQVRIGFGLVGYLTIIAFLNVLMHQRGVDSIVVVSNNIMLTAASSIALLQHYINERDFRAAFALARGLASEKERTEALLEEVRLADQQRIRWLESVAGFLRHELKNQLVGVKTSLALLDRRAGENAKPYADRALRSLQVMQHLIESATEATSLESALAEEEQHRLELAALVEERVADFQAMYPARRFVLERGSAELWILGSDERIVQMLDKLFGNAREHASGDGPIRVAIRARDGTACVTVENDGELLPPDRRLLFEPFVPGGKGDVAEHLGIGLYVARTIAHRHGGDIVADDLGDGRGVAFEVRLPLADAARPGTAQSSSQR